MLAVAAVAIVLIVAAACINLDRAAMGVTILAAFTTPWNGVIVGGERPGDLFILLGLVLFFVTGTTRPLPRIPGWVSQLGAFIVVVALLHQVIPTDSHYLAQRVVALPNGVVPASAVEPEGNLFIAAKFLVGVIGLPILFGCALQRRRENYRPIIIAFVAGVAVSAFVAFSDGFAGTSIGSKFTSVPNLHGREAGLTNHPNYLAASCIIALPIALGMLWWSSQRIRVFGGICSLFILLGTYASGSRGGFGGVLLGAAATFALDRRYRRHLATIVLIAGMAAFATFLVVPSAGHHLLVVTRLVSSTKTQGSDTARSIAHQQGMHDFLHSPIDGVGFQVAGEATNVYLQELASGGLLLFIGMQIFTISGLWTAVTVRRESEIGATLGVALLTAAVFNYFEAPLTDRFYYVPVALGIAIWSVTSARDDPVEVVATPTRSYRRQPVPAQR